MKLYISDTRAHDEPWSFQGSRLYRTAGGVSGAILEGLIGCEEEGDVVFHLGDFSPRPLETSHGNGVMFAPSRHTLIAGARDHLADPDPFVRRAYGSFFARRVGTEATWRENALMVEDELNGRAIRVLLSHAPQRDVRGADVNLYGMCPGALEEIMDATGDFGWVRANTDLYVPVAACVVGPRPVSLHTLLRRAEVRRAG